MNTPTPTPIPAEDGADTPLTTFSQCHVGIVEHLCRLAELPALIAPATRARKIAVDTLAFFDEVITEHHAEEERELFPAVRDSATRGEERDTVEAMIERLTGEHRYIEANWSRVKPGLKQLAKGLVADLEEALVEQLVSDYRAHARYEEERFLPLAQAILGRNANHMAALGLSLHMRHQRPVVGYI